MARMVGATREEVVLMNALTVNLHLGLVSTGAALASRGGALNIAMVTNCSSHWILLQPDQVSIIYWLVQFVTNSVLYKFPLW